MPLVECDECGQHAEIGLHHPVRSNTKRFLELRGIVTCDDGHKWPVAIKTNDVIVATDSIMPVVASADLNTGVPLGLRQDIEEAEHAHFAQVYKASVVMCRRAIQLGFTEPPHNIADGPFSTMLKQAQTKSPPPLSPRGFILTEGVKDYGDVGAHRKEEISALDARTVISHAVTVLNELFPS